MCAKKLVLYVTVVKLSLPFRRTYITVGLTWLDKKGAYTKIRKILLFYIAHIRNVSSTLMVMPLLSMSLPWLGASVIEQ